MAPPLLRGSLEDILISRSEAGYWRDVVGAEYENQPRLSLTIAQARRLWSIDAETAQQVLDSYVESGYLTLTDDGHYRRSDYAIALASGSGRS